MRPRCAKFQLRQGKNRWWSRIIVLVKGTSASISTYAEGETKRRLFHTREGIPDNIPREVDKEGERERKGREEERKRDENKNINYKLSLVASWQAVSAKFPFEKTQQTLAECAPRMRVEEFVLYLTDSPVKSYFRKQFQVSRSRRVAKGIFHSDGCIPPRWNAIVKTLNDLSRGKTAIYYIPGTHICPCYSEFRSV